MNGAPFDQTTIARPPNGPAAVAIVTDSVAQVPLNLARQLGISIVPYTVIVEGKTYQDGIDLIPKDLYQRMRLEKNLRISTSAPSIGQFYAAFRQCLQRGAENVVYIGLAGRMSGALVAAESAAQLVSEEMGSKKIVVVDSRLATIAEGFLAMEAAQMANQGVNLQQLLLQIEEIRKRTGFVGSLETLEYLARGGRIGKAAFMLSSAAHILPVLSMNDEGEVMPVCRVHGYGHALEEMVRYVSARVAGCRRLSLAVMHADVLHWAEDLLALAIERLHPDETLITDFTPVMVAHSGPGIIGLAYYWQP